MTGVQDKSTAELWTLQSTTTSAPLLAATEVELARRGETASGSTWLGARSSAALGSRKYARTGGNSTRPGRDCSDFGSAVEAQRFFLASGGPRSDPYNLDGDGDGLACEWGSYLRQVGQRQKAKAVAKAPVAKVPSYRRSSSYTCHTGPRGGRYHYSASGKKVYSGC